MSILDEFYNLHKRAQLYNEYFLHGSPYEFDSFDLEASSDGAIFLTRDPDTAEMYTGGKSGNFFEVKVNIDKGDILDLTGYGMGYANPQRFYQHWAVIFGEDSLRYIYEHIKNGDLYMSQMQDVVFEEIREMGYEGVRMSDHPSESFVIFNPADLEIVNRIPVSEVGDLYDTFRKFYDRYFRG